MKNFKLQILTPKGEFYNDEALGISLDTISGRIQILANHISYVSGVIPSSIKIKDNNGERAGMISEGLLCFSKNNALIFVTNVEWTVNNKEP